MSDYQLENRKKINDKIKGNYLMFFHISKNLYNLTAKRIYNFYNKNHFLDHNPFK